MGWRGVFLGTFAIASVIAGVHCRSATQIVIDVTTDVPCAQHGGTSIAVGLLGQFDQKGPATLATTCTGTGDVHTVGSLVVTPSGDDDEKVAFQVTTGIGIDPSQCKEGLANCIVERRSLYFIPHETVRIEVPMRRVCAAISCDPAATTCYAGACVSATIDPTRCKAEICQETDLPDGGTPPLDSGADAGPPPGPDSGIIDSGVPLDGTVGPPFDGGPLIVDTVDMAIGDSSMCLLKSGNVWCWGSNANAQLATTQTTQSASPLKVANLSGVVAIAGASETFAAKTSDGKLHMWGQAGDHVILGATGNQPNPVVATKISPFDTFCLGHAYGCGVTSDGGALQCWGEVAGYDNGKGAIDPPVQNPLPGQVKLIHCGDVVTTILLFDGRVFTFGEGSETLGRSTSALDPTVQPDSGTTPLQVTLPPIGNFGAGSQDDFAWQPDGTLWGWGTNDGNIINYTQNSEQPGRKVGLPQQIPLADFSGFSKIVAGDLFACGLRRGDVMCWGNNLHGVLGPSVAIGDRHDLPIKVPLPPPNAINIWAWGNNACAHGSDDEIYCWGDNQFGQLGGGNMDNGDGGTAGHPVPVPLLALPQ